MKATQKAVDGDTTILASALSSRRGGHFTNRRVEGPITRTKAAAMSLVLAKYQLHRSVVIDSQDIVATCYMGMAKRPAGLFRVGLAGGMSSNDVWGFHGL